MNSSSSGQNGSTAVPFYESYSSVLGKNITVVLLGIAINYLNGTLIHTFRNHQVFYHNPRYILFIHLVVNDMIQLTTAITLFVCYYVFFTINTFLCCFILAFVVFTTLNSPLNLAVMAVECYIAVCFPLQHSHLCSIKKIYIVIGCVWAVSILSFLPDIFYLAATRPLFFSTIICEMNNLFRHPIMIKKREVIFNMYLVGVWLVLIYIYIRIFLVARSAKNTKNDAKKARNTILLHSFQLLLCMFTYVYHAVQEVMYFSFPMTIFAHFLFVWYVLLQMLPRLLSSMVYGLRDKLFREHLKKHFSCSATTKVFKKTACVSAIRK